MSTPSVTPNAGMPARTIISQYANSPTIVSLINSLADCINPEADLDQFYQVVWNLDTARDFGLDILGRIVGVTRYLNIPVPGTFMGFDEAYTAPTASSGPQPMSVAPFYDGKPADTQTYRLTDDAYRTLILAKAASNISDGSAASVNRLLLLLFSGRGRAYVNDLGAMQMRLTFEFSLQPFEQAILTQSGVIPRPAGVQLFIAELPQRNTFGFAEMGSLSAAPFGEGTFFGGVIDAA